MTSLGLANSLENPSRPYTIKKSEFVTPFVGEMERFSADRRVIRASFVDFLIVTTAIGRGDIRAQRAYLMWLRAKHNFGGIGTFRNFDQAGGWRCLNPTEQGSIIDRFKRVRGHFESGVKVAEQYKDESGQLDEIGLLDRLQKDIHNISYKDSSYVRSEMAERGVIDLRGLSEKEMIKLAQSSFPYPYR